MLRIDKPLVWLHGQVKTPPFTATARLEAGFLLRKLQLGETLSLPYSRPIPVIGKHCHELRIIDQNLTWRIIYKLDKDAVVILEVFKKKTKTTSQKVITNCKKRLRDYDETS